MLTVTPADSRANRSGENEWLSTPKAGSRAGSGGYPVAQEPALLGSEWLGCHLPVMAAIVTLWALARSLDWARVRLECKRGAWDSRWTLPSVLQN